jgi:hypothetical protein
MSWVRAAFQGHGVAFCFSSYGFEQTSLKPCAPLRNLKSQGKERQKVLFSTKDTRDTFCQDSVQEMSGLKVKSTTQKMLPFLLGSFASPWRKQCHPMGLRGVQPPHSRVFSSLTQPTDTTWQPRAQLQATRALTGSPSSAIHPGLLHLHLPTALLRKTVGSHKDYALRTSSLWEGRGGA